MVRVIVTKKFYFSWDFLWMEFSCLRAQSPWCPHLISMELFVLIKERVRAQLGLWWWGSVGSSGLGKLLGATCLFILLMKKVRLKKKMAFPSLLEALRSVWTQISPKRTPSAVGGTIPKFFLIILAHHMASQCRRSSSRESFSQRIRPLSGVF